MIGLISSIIPRSFLIPAILLIGILGFYEGVPGAAYIPFLGEYLTGRVGYAYQRGQLAERLLWEDQRTRDLALAASKLSDAQVRIDALDSEYWRSQTDQAIKISDLEHALEMEKHDNAKDTSGTCHPLVSRRLRDSLQAIGH